MDTTFADLLAKMLRQKMSTICLPEIFDDRVALSAKWLLDKKLVAKVLVPEFSKLTSTTSCVDYKTLISKQELVQFSDFDSNIIDSTKSHIKIKSEARQKKLSEEKLKQLVEHPLCQSAFLLSKNKCDAVVAGAHYSTADVIRYGLLNLDLGTEKLVSSCFVFSKQNASKSNFIFADAGVIVDPTADELCKIAMASVKTWTSLFQEEPKVAFLSFATHQSADHPFVSKIKLATDNFRSNSPTVKCDGPVQFDSAWDEKVGLKKGLDASIAGKANIFIFPDLNSANIAYKIAARLGSYQAYGPLLQGFSKPYTDLSRGASVEEIIVSCLLQLLIAQNKSKESQNG